MIDWSQEYTAEQRQADADETAKSRRERALREAYQKEADPLFFKCQRGEATEQDWLEKVAEIKQRFQEL